MNSVGVYIYIPGAAMTSSQTNLDIAGRIARSLTSSQAGPRTDGGKMADLTPDFQSFVRESLTLLISVGEGRAK